MRRKERKHAIHLSESSCDRMREIYLETKRLIVRRKLGSKEEECRLIDAVSLEESDDTGVIERLIYLKRDVVFLARHYHRPI